jgi:hypothetical protein
MFATIARSWQFTKISYGIIWDFKKLLLFPALSIMAVTAVIASFVAPLWASGTIEAWLDAAGGESGPATADRAVMGALLFLFYFASYFVIVFFNSALTACAFKAISGEAPTLGYGLSMAGRRLPQILGWAFISAVIGVLLRAVENAHKDAGRIVSRVLGSAWTALTFFVVPVLVLDGLGPLKAIKRSTVTLKATWGEALSANISLGFLAFLLMLPVVLACAGVLAVARSSGNGPLMVGALVAGILLIAAVSAVTSAADVVLKALLYNYATDRSVPADVDGALFEQAFRSSR